MDRPTTVYIFDGVDSVDSRDARGMNERVAACYAWAEKRGLAVLDEIICWIPRCRPDRAAALAVVVAACRRDQAALLVHSPAMLPPAPSALGDLVSLPLWSVLDATPGGRPEQQDPPRGGRPTGENPTTYPPTPPPSDQPLKDAVGLLGDPDRFPATAYAGHSLRAGFATQAATAYAGHSLRAGFATRPPPASPWTGSCARPDTTASPSPCATSAGPTSGRANPSAALGL